MTIFNKISAALKKDPDLVSRILMIVVILVLLAFAIRLSGTKHESGEFPAATPTPVPLVENAAGAGSETLPYDPLSDYAQTTGLVVGAGGLVLVLFVGILIELFSERKSKRELTKSDSQQH